MMTRRATSWLVLIGAVLEIADALSKGKVYAAPGVADLNRLTIATTKQSLGFSLILGAAVVEALNVTGR